MTNFSYICIVSISTCVFLLSAELQVDVSGPVGSTAVLPCELTSIDPKNIPNITWFNKSDTVFERPAKTSNQVKRYEGRVDVPVEKGNCSLVLHNLTLSDTGVYTSYQAGSDTKGGTVPISRVNLTVYEIIRDVPPTPPDDAVMKSPHPLVLVLSLVSCSLVQLFCGET